MPERPTMKELDALLAVVMHARSLRMYDEGSVTAENVRTAKDYLDRQYN